MFHCFLHLPMCISPALKRLSPYSIILFYSISSAVLADSDSRHALIIGNGAYHHATVLNNPINDSNDIAQTLAKLHFDTTLLTNVTKQKLEEAVSTFLDKLREEGGVGLFYYAGHGVQLQGENYLVPVETQAGTDDQIKFQSFNISKLLTGLGQIKTTTNIIILDACRDNPFKNMAPAGTRSATPMNSRGLRKEIPKLDSGLSKLDAPPNTLIAFATAPGRVALDGKGRNSPYTHKLVTSMQRAGLTIGEVFRQVRADVVKETNGQQIPWESSSLIHDFYFKPRTAIPMGF